MLACALLERGFRPFFLLGALHAAIFVPTWTAIWLGWLPMPRWLTPQAWHAHEMLSGVVAAAVSGFLLTAVPNWTGAPPVRGALLGALAALWLAGRIVFASASLLPASLLSIVDGAFLPALTAVLAPSLFRADQRRNQIFFWLLSGWAGLNLYVHALALGWTEGFVPRLIHLPVHLVVVIVVVVAGRVIPLFTANTLQRWGETDVVRVYGPLTPLSIALLLAALAMDAATVLAGATLAKQAAVLRLSAAVVLLIRAWGWRGMRTLRDPLLWSLHLAFAWVPVGLLLDGMSELLPVLPKVAGLHALGIGGFGGLILAMMTRISLGHTGRPLVAPRAMTPAYVAMALASLVRVTGAIVPGGSIASLWLAAALWSLALGLFAWRYAPILWSSRVDGRAG